MSSGPLGRNGYDFGGALNALSASPDGTCVVSGGREVLRIVTIDRDEPMRERLNLRHGRLKNLNLSTNDVAWHPLQENANLICTAATNGAVVLWDLNIKAGSKQQRVLTDHNRTVNRVTWHKGNADSLLSGSQDGTIKLWDIRDPGSKSKLTFDGNSEAVRDVQCSPRYGNYFIAGFDNGNIQIWDMRNPKQYARQITAHQGLVLSVEWHPEDQNALASAGRDRMIKVWDLNHTSKPIHTVQTIAAVGRVKWRPQHKHHIAAASSLIDFNVHIWDLRSPYIPTMSLSEHRDVATGLLWDPADPTSGDMLSCSKDGYLLRQSLDHAQQPYRDIKSVCASWSPHNQIAVVSEHIDRDIADDVDNADDVPSLYALATGESAPASAARKKAKKAPVKLRVFPEGQSDPLVNSTTVFKFLARHYKLRGASVAMLCEYNAIIAEHMHLWQVANSWRVARSVYATKEDTAQAAAQAAASALAALEATTAAVAVAAEQSAATTTANVHGNGNADGNPNQNAYANGNGIGGGGARAPAGAGAGAGAGAAGGAAGGGFANASATGNTATPAAGGAFPVPSGLNTTLGMRSSGGLASPAASARFSQLLAARSSGEFGMMTPDLTDMAGLELLMDSTSDANMLFDHTYSEAGLLRAPVTGDEDGDAEVHFDPIGMAVGGEGNMLLGMQRRAAQEQGLIQMPDVLVEETTGWSCSDAMLDALSFYCDQGDVQTCGVMAVVLRSKLPKMEDAQYNRWVVSYIDMLQQHQLWDLSADLVRHCGLPAVEAVSQQSTTIHTSCSSCAKPLNDSPSACTKCSEEKGPNNSCVICRMPVNGLFVWCKGCGHGGHLSHLKAWFEDNRVCPTGCGHQCNYAGHKN